jgi:cholesterol transport system auxiliary component
VSWQLLVVQPIAPAGIDTSRIALGPSPLTLDYFAGASWTDSAPQLVQTLLIQSFENTGDIVSVGRDSSLLRADFILLTELRQFQADYSQGGQNNPPIVRVRVNLKLVKMPEREIVAGETFDAAVPAAGNSLAEIVDAFDEAIGKVMRRTVEWTLRQGANAYAEERHAPTRDGRKGRSPPRDDGQAGAPAG